MKRRRRWWQGSRGFSAVELAAGFAVLGSTAAVALPAFVRELKASRFVEPTEGLAALASGALTYAASHTTPISVALAFPRSVLLTPSVPPRGRLMRDPPGTWGDPTWVALGFPATSSGGGFLEGEPHAFAFGFESVLAPTRSTFVAHAHADLDGDGALSTFEVRGQATPGEAAVIEPGMYVEAPLE